MHQRSDVAFTSTAGPIRQEDGARYYEEAWGGDNSTTVKFFESWSSMRSLYKHIYTSPAVERVFRSAAFGPLLADRPKLEGPFKVRCE
jgi:quinol monooxygenase YgiN